MAANTALGTVTSFPRTLVVSGVATTWQEISLPRSIHCHAVSVYLSAAGKVSFTGDNSASNPADGGAVSGNTQPIAATTWVSYPLGPPPNRPISIFVAADTGTLTATLSAEG